MNLQRNLAAAGFLLAALAAPVAHATGTTAGTLITNTATLTFDAPDPTDPTGPKVPQTPVPATKNFAVDKVLDVTVAKVGSGITIVTPEATQREIKFTVTNNGNGGEQYNLVADYADTTDKFDPTGVTFWIDSDNDGTVDYQYIQGTTNLVLAPDQKVTVVVRGDIPANRSSQAGGGALVSGDDSNVTLRALSDTLQQANNSYVNNFQSGVPGTAVGTPVVVNVPGGTTVTYQAIIGTTKADGRDLGKYLVQMISANLKKDAKATHPTLGNDKFVPGAEITYSLTLEVLGEGTLDKVLIKDNVPANTTYQSGTMAIAYGEGATVAAATTAALAATPVTLQEAGNGDVGLKVNDEIDVVPGGNDGNLASGTVTVGGTQQPAKVYIVTFKVKVN